MQESQEYNPLDYDNLTKDCIRELMSQPAGALPPEKEFSGSGVYALYYTGDFVPYASIRSPMAERPIYVGSAAPAGTRKGRRISTGARGKTLYNRLRDHARSIQAAENLELEDFLCRYLVVVRFWIPIVERFLLDTYQPIWNVCIDGFGLHDPGVARRGGEISWWDALHPGRPKHILLRPTRTAADAEARLKECLESHQE